MHVYILSTTRSSKGINQYSVFILVSFYLFQFINLYCRGPALEGGSISGRAGGEIPGGSGSLARGYRNTDALYDRYKSRLKGNQF